MILHSGLDDVIIDMHSRLGRDVQLIAQLSNISDPDTYDPSVPHIYLRHLPEWECMIAEVMRCQLL